MSEPKASIMVHVDRTNPGQFFACCGLFELAEHLWPGVEAWFEDMTFCLGSGTLAELLGSLVDCTLTNTMTAEQHARLEALGQILRTQRKELKEAKGNQQRSQELRDEIDALEAEKKQLEKLRREEPILLTGTHYLRVDWFTDDFAGGSRFKTWAGQQSVLDIASSMKTALDKEHAWRNERCLAFSTTRCGLPFNFDSDLGVQGGAIDVGFSFDPLAASALTRIEPSARPALELLAFIGLQRFRPAQIQRENRFLYSRWGRPLAIQIAMPAACGAMPVADSRSFEFRLLYRTKYLKSFLPAVPFIGGSDE